MNALRTIGRAVFADYALYRIYALCPSGCSDPSPGEIAYSEIQNSHDLLGQAGTEIRSLSGYAGDSAFGYGAWRGAELLAAAWYWTGARLETRGWRYVPRFASELVQIAVSPEWRGKGIGTGLVRFSSRRMRELGYQYLFARIWHSHVASYSMFERAGYRYTGFLVDLRPRGLGRSLRFCTRCGLWPHWEFFEEDAAPPLPRAAAFPGRRV